MMVTTRETRTDAGSREHGHTTGSMGGTTTPGRAPGGDLRGLPYDAQVQALAPSSGAPGAVQLEPDSSSGAFEPPPLMTMHETRASTTSTRHTTEPRPQDAPQGRSKPPPKSRWERFKADLRWLDNYIKGNATQSFGVHIWGMGSGQGSTATRATPDANVIGTFDFKEFMETMDVLMTVLPQGSNHHNALNQIRQGIDLGDPEVVATYVHDFLDTCGVLDVSLYGSAEVVPRDRSGGSAPGSTSPAATAAAEGLMPTPGAPRPGSAPSSSTPSSGLGYGSAGLGARIVEGAEGAKEAASPPDELLSAPTPKDPKPGADEVLVRVGDRLVARKAWQLPVHEWHGRLGVNNYIRQEYADGKRITYINTAQRGLGYQPCKDQVSDWERVASRRKDKDGHWLDRFSGSLTLRKQP